jgi:NADPH:quinone reductase-like Zn-dependent oxidoreductase
MSAGWPKPKNYVPGYDVAGYVNAVGKNIEQFQPGDEVFGTCKGTCAEYVCAGEKNFLLKPANLTLEQAAAVPVIFHSWLSQFYHTQLLTASHIY